MPSIPITTQLSIEEFSGGAIVVPQSMCTNVIYGKYPSGNIFATQRPSVNIFEDASVTVADAKGRGVYHSNLINDRYIVNDNVVYKGNYTAPLAQLISSGVERVEMFEVGDFLVILDTENNEGWTIAIGTPTVLVAITDVAFPPNQSPSLQLTKGGAELNGTLYVYTTDGQIWNSAVEDPTSWNTLDSIVSEVRSDGGVALFKHSNHIAALGERSLEFFYDNANPTGSPLSPRTDVTHDIGTVNFDTFYGDGNASYFVGLTESGDVGVYLLQNFSLTKISKNDIDSMLTSAVVTDSVRVVGSGFSAGGRGFYVLTLYNLSGGIVASETSLVYDSSTGFWNPWELAHDGINDYPLVDWTRSSGTRAGNGILSNGDILTISDDFNPQDAVEAQVYVDADYVDMGYISDTGVSGNKIPFEIITGAGSFGTQNNKFIGTTRIKGRPTNNPEQLLVQWSDESNKNYNAGRTIDLSNQKNKLNRCGSFKRRNFKLSGAFSERVEIESVEVE